MPSRLAGVFYEDTERGHSPSRRQECRGSGEREGEKEEVKQEDRKGGIVLKRENWKKEVKEGQRK